jgi:hypothetical protein
LRQTGFAGLDGLQNKPFIDPAAHPEGAARLAVDRNQRRPRLDGLAITPSRTNRLAATGAAVAVGAAAPSRRATAAGSAAAVGATTEGVVPTEVLDAPPHKPNPHHARLAAAKAHRTSVTRRAVHLLCELITME